MGDSNSRATVNHTRVCGKVQTMNKAKEQKFIVRQHGTGMVWSRVGYNGKPGWVAGGTNCAARFTQAEIDELLLQLVVIGNDNPVIIPWGKK